MSVRNGATSTWTPEKIAVVQQHWGHGKSAREIGKLIGMTKGSVLGKAHRLGLAGDPYPATRPDRAQSPFCEKPRMRVHLRSAETRHHAKGTVKNRVGSSAGITAGFQAPRYDECQWLEGEPRERNFCGLPSIPGPSSYCEAHHRRCRVPERSRAA